MTSSATLPSNARGTPERPWLAMTIRSAGHSFAFLTIVGAGMPVCTNSCAEAEYSRAERESKSLLSSLRDRLSLPPSSGDPGGGSGDGPAVLCAGHGGKDHFRGGFRFGLTFSLVG